MRDDEDASRKIYAGPLFHIGQFRRGPRHPNFRGPHFNDGIMMVFPRTSVMITHAGGEPVVADPNVVMFYNDHQHYSRQALSEKGDLCEWFGFDDALVADAVRPFDPHVDDHPSNPFSFSHGPSDAASYLMQRLVVNHILSNEPLDQLFIEETVLSTLKRALWNRFQQEGQLPQRVRVSSEREIAQALQTILATHFEANLSLGQLSADLNYSAFHLCRVFHKHTGLSIHQYLKQLRLRTALEYLTQANADLSSLAVDLGFSSHSHFTEAFRRTFGSPPSALRQASRQSLRQVLSKISIA